MNNAKDQTGERTGIIYKITNNVSGKIYIGKTVNTLRKRWNDHVSEAYHKPWENSPLHKAIVKYGRDAFTQECIEDNIPESELNDKQIYYIALYNSTDSSIGYNATLGGDGGIARFKLTFKDAKNIIEDLKNPNLHFKEIAEKYGMTTASISGINQGRNWVVPGETYPIRKINGSFWGVNLKTYDSIVHDIIYEQDLNFKEIAKKNGVTVNKVYSINRGKGCYTNNSPYYKGHCPDSFPIRKQYAVNIDYGKATYEILFTDKPISQIERDFNVGANTVQDLNAGTRHKDKLKGFIFPMRKHIEENRDVWKQKYGQETA